MLRPGAQLPLIAIGVASVLAVAVSAAAEVRPRLGMNDGAYAREIAEAAAVHAVPGRLIWAVIRAESNFDPRAVSPKGAQGLMQLMPETTAILGVHDVFDPRENIHAGTRHLKAMLVRFRYDLRLAVAAYNAGARPVRVYRGVPPYPETRAHVARVLRFYGASAAEPPAPVADGVLRFVRPDGTVVYTNISYGHRARRR